MRQVVIYRSQIDYLKFMIFVPEKVTMLIGQGNEYVSY